MDALYKWLLEDSNPAIKYRTQKELLNQNVDNEAVKKWILDKVPASWYETNGLWYRYYVAALAECGLSKQDVELEKFSKAFDELNNKFEWSCADFMLLTSLVKLGFQEHETIKRVIEEWNKCSLTDGGFLCSQKLKKFDYIPKSCYKVNLHALLFVAECSKHEPFIKYHKEQWELKGFARKKYERNHIYELESYDLYRKELKKKIVEPDKKITPKAWKKELAQLEKKLDEIREPFGEVIVNLSSIELLEYNKKELGRMMENEKHQKELSINQSRKKTEQSL